MSCFHVGPETIKMIAIAATCRYSANVEAAQEAARVLREANNSAMADRYHDEDDREPVPTVTLAEVTWWRTQFNAAAKRGDAGPAVGNLKAVQCYEYQACDWREYQGSDAERFASHARSSLLACLPGYDEAPWGLD